MTALAYHSRTELPTLATIADYANRANEYAEASKASSTQKAYAIDMADFGAFVGAYGAETVPAAWRSSLPTPRTWPIAAYLSLLSAGAWWRSRRHTNPPATIRRPRRNRFATSSPALLARRAHGKDALSSDMLAPVVLWLAGGGLKAKRDRAIVLLGFAIAAHRSELAALDVADLRFDQRGLLVTIRKSKTDQKGVGAEIGVPFISNEGLCAARAVRAWLKLAQITSGPVFRTFSKTRVLQTNRIDGADVARLVKRVAGLAGIAGDFAGHSLRAGFVTSAAAFPGVSEVDIMRVSRHRSVAILRGYVRRATVFEKAPLSSIFGAAK